MTRNALYVSDDLFKLDTALRIVLKAWIMIELSAPLLLRTAFRRNGFWFLCL
ncbi:hypothetical protein CY34DRAFT_805867 [Suillus luteus UH-Slu-Lm8-n1]|uniref:Uncharacterized protein n=1 Tax=Suillus luteus UH-Slu-Lm8-n1 TaxID=930992 RepID=A0A0D0BE82_9AGAM|nr:hypothetical protein CY34DRAFT_805867 [Suillus luteus UH-Slu-Lm8-n1]